MKISRSQKRFLENINRFDIPTKSKPNLSKNQVPASVPPSSASPCPWLTANDSAGPKTNPSARVFVADGVEPLENTSLCFDVELFQGVEVSK
jgi:hypothetical protein